MKFKNLPKSWRGININIIATESVADVTDKYTIEFSNAKINCTAEFYIPKTEGNRFFMNGNQYVVWYRLCKPICSVEYINNKQVLYIHNILTRPDRIENYDMKFYIEDGQVICEYKNKKYSIDNTYLHDIFYSYWFMNSDRDDLNEFIGSESEANYITHEDVINIKYILENEPNYVTNWKDIFSMRIIGLEDLIESVIMLSIPKALKNFFKGSIDSQILTRNVRSFLATDSPEIRIDLNDTKIGSYAQNKKVILPFDNYCDVNEIIPDKTWFKYLDLLDSPQSIKVGSVASFVDNVQIVNKKIKVDLNEMLNFYASI